MLKHWHEPKYWTYNHKCIKPVMADTGLSKTLSTANVHSDACNTNVTHQACNMQVTHQAFTAFLKPQKSALLFSNKMQRKCCSGCKKPKV